MRSSNWYLLVALCVTTACQPATPAGLTDADRTAIDAQEQAFTKFALAGDYAALVKAYYTDSALFMAPNMKSATGRAEIEAALHTFPPVTSFTLQTEEVVGTADLAYVRGKYKMTMTPPGGAAIPDEGKYLEIWKKQADGSWKATRDMFNSDLPLSEPAPAKKK